MKSFKQHLIKAVIWKTLLEAASPELVQRVKAAIDDVDDNKILQNILNTVFEPRLRMKVDELFTDRQIKKDKDSHVEVMVRKILNMRGSDQDKMELVDEMLRGEAYDVVSLVDSATSRPTYIWNHVKSKTALLRGGRNGEFLPWLASWAPQYDNVNVGRGEALMVLNDAGASKPDAGDLQLTNGYKVEVKGTRKGSGANFGVSSDFRAGKVLLQEYLDKYNITGDINTIGLASSSASTLSINLNKASKAMYDLGANDRELDSMWYEVCKASMGSSGAPVKFDGVVKDGVTNATNWMTRWCANGLNQYQNKTPYTHLFIFDYETGYSVAWKDSQQFVRLAEAGLVDFDFAIGWDGGGWIQNGKGAATCRMLAQKMTKASEGVDQRAIDIALKGAKQIKAMETFMQKHRNKRAKASTLTDLLDMPSNIADVGPSTRVKTADEAEKWNLVKEHIKKLFISLASSMDRDTKSRLYKQYIVFANEIKQNIAKFDYVYGTAALK
jgi:hypothetical protein